MSELNLDGMVIAPSVIETIVSLAVNDVEGVASVAGSGGMRLFGNRASGQGIEVSSNEEHALVIDVHVVVCQGVSLPKVAVDIREAVAGAVTTQVGLPVAAVDVYVDAIHFD